MLDGQLKLVFIILRKLVTRLSRSDASVNDELVADNAEEQSRSILQRHKQEHILALLVADFNTKILASNRQSNH